MKKFVSDSLKDYYLFAKRKKKKRFQIFSKFSFCFFFSGRFALWRSFLVIAINNLKSLFHVWNFMTISQGKTSTLLMTLPFLYFFFMRKSWIYFCAEQKATFAVMIFIFTMETFYEDGRSRSLVLGSISPFRLESSYGGECWCVCVCASVCVRIKHRRETFLALLRNCVFFRSRGFV